jgi:hypothetical protein
MAYYYKFRLKSGGIRSGGIYLLIGFIYFLRILIKIQINKK